MASTKLANIINPEIIADMAVEMLPEKVAFLDSEAVDTSVETGIENGGTHLTLSYFAEDGADMEEVDETNDLTARALTENEELGVVVRRAELVSVGDLAKLVAHRDPNASLAGRFAGKAGKSIDKSLVSVAIGATPSDNTHDVAVATGTAVKLDSEVILDAQYLIGDQMDDLALIIMHSKVYTDLRKANLIDFIMPSEASAPIPFYGGKRVIVSDRCPVDTTTPSYYEYTSFLVGKGALVLDYQRDLEIETDRDISGKVAVDLIRADVDYLPHLKGMSFSSAITLPTEANLQDSTKWTQKAYSAKGIKMVKVITN